MSEEATGQPTGAPAENTVDLGVLPKELFLETPVKVDTPAAVVENNDAPAITTNEDGSFSITTKVNGEDQVLSLSADDLLDRVRKGETFFQNQADLKQREEAFQLEKSQNTDVDQSLIAQARVLQDLQKNDPKAFNELIYKTNNGMLEEQAPAELKPSDSVNSLASSLKAMVKENPNLVVLNEIGDAMISLSLDNQKMQRELATQLKGLEGKQETFAQNENIRVQQSQAQVHQNGLNTEVARLKSKGVTQDKIVELSASFDALQKSGHTYQQAGEIVYGRFYKAAAPANVAPVVTAEIPYNPSAPASSGSAVVNSNTQFAEVTNALFGDELT